MILGKIELPAAVVNIIKQLEQTSHHAYIVGGCVRDSLLGVAPTDWDLATSATPQEVIASFPGYKVLPTGIDHGTVTLRLEGEGYEITTFRTDGDYQDHRRPTAVTFTTSLKEDLARRDFTMNALAYHPERGIFDYYGGVEDLSEGRIRCVGDPGERFEEDALRILRGARFASQLGFEIEPKTAQAMLDARESLDYISPERIQAELNKALLGDFFRPVFQEYSSLLSQIIPEIQELIGFDQHTHYHTLDVYEHTLKSVEAAPKDLLLRLTMLLHDIGKPACFKSDSKGVGHFPGHAGVGGAMAATIMKRLRYSSAVIQQVVTLIEYHGLDFPPATKVVRRWLGRLGEKGFTQLLEVQRADAASKSPKYGRIQLLNIAGVERVLERVIEENQCVTLKQLEITGKDLLEIGIPQGPEIGGLLNQLLSLVIKDQIPNQQEELLDYVKERRRKKEH